MKNFFFLLLAATLLSLSSCKPTEKNYKAAYDAALSKKEAAEADVDQNIAVSKLQQVEGAQLKNIDGIEVYVLNKRIKPAVEGMELPGNYNVAVGAYKLITNCRSQAAQLKSEGFDAFPAKETDDLYYTVAASFPTLKEAVDFYQQYRKKSGRVYVGLPEAPVIIYSPK